MTSAVLRLAAPAMLAATVAAAPWSAHQPMRPRALRVCADPNNMPFSDSAGHGFENRIASLVARDLHEPVAYTWWAQRRGFVRNTLGAQRCDVVIGIIAGDEQLSTTTPYYRSTYVFVTRRSSNLHLASMNDPRLRRVRIGIHVIGDDYNSLPPGVALAGRGIVRNVVGYSIYGNYAEPNPPAALIEGVERGDVDVAVAWGPLAGYFAKHSPVPLVVAPIEPSMDARTGTVFTFPIAIGVRKGNEALRDVLQRVIDRDGARIHAILNEYGVPMVTGREE